MRKRFAGRRTGIASDARRPSDKDFSPSSTGKHPFHTPSIDPMFSRISANLDQSFSPFASFQHREKCLNKYNQNGVFTAKNRRPLALTQTPRSRLHFSQHALQKITK
ncbi:hypothetical protein [Burkholderia cepacia]|uniref:hypothetical protein n=1 Tax=Burkholderia cepacia TaxID=292 RepID=UPI0012D95FA6|nr:hypothetical protein [Burkholderia cepacia]